jgi:hypothetical protein
MGYVIELKSVTEYTIKMVHGGGLAKASNNSYLLVPTTDTGALFLNQCKGCSLQIDLANGDVNVTGAGGSIPVYSVHDVLSIRLGGKDMTTEIRSQLEK